MTTIIERLRLWPLVLLVALLMPLAALADTPRQGLMWNRSGLPAVFPLILKTSPGHDYFVLLRRVDDGTAVLAAFARGGAFFRVLVPPGSFQVSIRRGVGWQGEDKVFGPDTEDVSPKVPLTFAVRGLRTKVGHIIDLRGDAQGVLAAVSGAMICQRWERVWRPEDLFDNPLDRPPPLYRLREVQCG